MKALSSAALSWAAETNCATKLPLKWYVRICFNRSTGTEVVTSCITVSVTGCAIIILVMIVQSFAHRINLMTYMKKAQLLPCVTSHKNQVILYGSKLTATEEIWENDFLIGIVFLFSRQKCNGSIQRWLGEHQRSWCKCEPRPLQRVREGQWQLL